MLRIIHKTKKAAAAVLVGVICIAFAAQSANAAAIRVQTYVPGYGDVDLDELGITDEMLEQYMQQAENIDMSNPDEARAQIKELAGQAGYSISDEDAESVRQVLDTAEQTGMGADEMKGMYEAYKGLDETMQETGNFFDAVKGFFVNIFNVIKDFFAGLFNLK